MTKDTAEKRAVFRRLHAEGCFVMPNPFDRGSALYLQGLGFPALASTSIGFAWTTGHADNRTPLDLVLAHLRDLATLDVPINADFEGGFAHDPSQVAANVVRAVETGVAGLSIEDSTDDPAAPLFDIAQGAARIRAARLAIDRTGTGVILTGRAENFVVGRPDLDDAIERLVAYAAAGADCLFAPGLTTPEQVSAVVKAVAPKPVNIGGANPAFTTAQLAALGVRRISVGGALARAAWGEFMRASQELAEKGSFTALSRAPSGRDINKLFG